MKTLKQFAAVTFLVASLALGAFAQYQGGPYQGAQSLTQTTLSGAVLNADAGASGYVQLTSTANVLCCANQATILFVDSEAMYVAAPLPATGNNVAVVRGYNSTQARTHASGATVWVGRPNLFTTYDPTGTCTQAPGGAAFGQPGGTPASSTFAVFPFINVRNGREWSCVNITGQASPLTGQWMVINGLIELGPGACGSGTSGNLTLAGPTVAGASFVGVQQVSTTSTGTNTHYYSCNLNNIVSALANSPPKQVAVLDATFFYGVQTTGLGTQVATLASGTLNSIAVFSKIAFPAAGAAETPSTVTPVRADAGTLLITPAVASFNVATTTAGAFYSAKFTPASAIPLTTDGTEVFFNVALLNTATSATITNSPGVLVHYAWIPEGIGVQF